MTEELQPFRIAVPDSDLADLRDRLDRVRWAPEPRGGDEGYGVSLATVQRLVAYWRDRYDWRAWESRINQYPQFTTRAFTPKRTGSSRRTARRRSRPACPCRWP